MGWLLCMALLCVHSPVGAQPPDPETLRSHVEALAEDSRIGGAAVADRWFLIRFYERREFTPVWGTAAKLDALMAAVAGSRRHGLDPGDYHLEWLQTLDALLRTEPTPDLAAALDILATDALARLAFHLHFGKLDPEKFEPVPDFTSGLSGTHPFDALESLLAADDLSASLGALAPQHPRYRELVAWLAAYREIAVGGGWPAIAAGETLHAGMQAPRVATMRELLHGTGDLSSGDSYPDPELFDEALELAVRRFQDRHGLEVDGVVGSRTHAAMSVPVEARIEQIRVNLERLRWILRNLEARYILADIARFRVFLVEGGEVVWSTRAVVGRPYRQTPVFQAQMRYLVFNPTWTVPPVILAHDLLPEIRKDPGTLARKRMTVLDLQGRPVDPEGIDWDRVRVGNFPYMIRQEPGPDNALGRVKFMYPNRYHVYMHDTPARELFARTERTFSSGCIRLEDPMGLVRLLLADTEWDEAAVEQVLADGGSRTVSLPRPLPVLTIYATAIPEDDRILFLPDVYRRDQKVLTALDRPLAPTTDPEEAVLPQR